MTRIHFLLLLDRLEEIITKSPRVAGRSLVVKDEFIELLDKIRLTLPPEVKKADKLISKREEYIKKTREEAERIIREATQKAEQILSEHYLLKEAEEEAEKITAEAEEYARRVKTELKEYVNRVIGILEKNLLQALQILRRISNEFNKEEEDKEE